MVRDNPNNIRNVRTKFKRLVKVLNSWKWIFVDNNNNLFNL